MIDEFWEFARRRQKLMYTGETDDPILQQFRFTNCYRACDRVSQYLIKHIVNTTSYVSSRDGVTWDMDSADILFRVFLFKTFNKIDTWEYLEHRHPVHLLVWDPFIPGWISRTLRARVKAGHTLYAPAFRQPIGRTSYGYEEKFENHIEMIRYVMEHRQAIFECRSLESLYLTLCEVPMLGPFLAMQFATDLNYTNLFDFSENDFIMPGPGALRGSTKVFPRSEWKNYDAARENIRYLVDIQENALFPIIPGHRLSLMDVQNMLCEFDKYCRIAHPELNTVGRWKKGSAKRPKQRYEPNPNGRLRWPQDYEFPHKWKISTTELCSAI